MRAAWSPKRQRPMLRWVQAVGSYRCHDGSAQPSAASAARCRDDRHGTDAVRLRSLPPKATGALVGCGGGGGCGAAVFVAAAAGALLSLPGLLSANGAVGAGASAVLANAGTSSAKLLCALSGRLGCAMTTAASGTALSRAAASSSAG
eukprot:TRINITY_DN243_c0_g2_i1.p2 TRINITY_DN243_c0_g2~~TRINITY_DN243_c0_g2_i1.p2  ORF type:complete len:148 (-),score=35.97 TRINITY_DN243_c0_g2_i1:507-950(-)